MPEAKRWLEPIARTDAPDLWGQALQRAERPIPMLRRTNRGLRTAAILVAAALVVGLALYGLSGLNGNGSQPEGPSDSLSTSTNPAGIPVSVQYPADWYSAVAMTSPAYTGVNTWVGLVVSNAAAAMPKKSRPNGPDYLPVSPDLPTTYVTVKIMRRPPVASILLKNSPLPLSMSNATVAPGHRNYRYLTAVVGGRPVLISVEAGPDASPADLARADQIVASIRSTSSAISPYDLAGPTVDGGQITAAYVSGKVVVVGAWASWCTYCRAEVVELQRVASIYSDNPDVLVLGINVDDTEAAARALLARYHATFQSLAVGSDVAARFGFTTLPVSVVVDADGHLHPLQLGAPTNPGARSAIRGQVRRIRSTVDAALP